jgi:acetoin utilization deacetylase AcuC-like enzyme
VTLFVVCTGGKAPTEMTEEDLLRKHEANEQRRLRSLKEKREAEENIKAKIRKAVSSKFRSKARGSSRGARQGAAAAAGQVLGAGGEGEQVRIGEEGCMEDYTLVLASIMSAFLPLATRICVGCCLKAAVQLKQGGSGLFFYPCRCS